MFNYKGHIFSIIDTKDIETLCCERKMLKNSVLSSIAPYATNSNRILLLRRTNDIDQPFITIAATKRKQIREIRGENDSFAPQEVYLFLESYCRYKGLRYDPVSIILEDEITEISEDDRELFEYIYYYYKRLLILSNKEKNKKKTYKDFAQEDMRNMFPEAMDTYTCDRVENDPLDDCCGFNINEIVGEYKRTSNILDEFIWNHMDDVLALKYDNNEMTEFQLCLIEILKEIDVNPETFDQIWELSEAYSIFEIDFFLLQLYKEFLTKDEEQLLINRWSSEKFDDMQQKWDK